MLGEDHLHRSRPVVVINIKMKPTGRKELCIHTFMTDTQAYRSISASRGLRDQNRGFGVG